jgi:hypothetical protein
MMHAADTEQGGDRRGFTTIASILASKQKTKVHGIPLPFDLSRHLIPHFSTLFVASSESRKMATRVFVTALPSTRPPCECLT